MVAETGYQMVLMLSALGTCVHWCSVIQIRSNALIKRGSMLMQNGSEEESRRDFAQAIVEDPNNSDIFHHRGQV